MNVALPSQHLNIISLCTGGGGLDLGLELAMPGARPILYVEREAFACGHLVSAMQKGLLAEAPIWSDARTFNGRPWRGLVDGIIGGIPCQPHSLAGKRLGEDDERDLWSDARRIIVQSGAWFVLIENVRGIVSSGGAERVWRDLRRLGFDLEAGLFTASEVGASHERERWFALAVADRDNEHDNGAGIVGTRWRRQFADGGCDVGHANHARLERYGQHGECPGEWTSRPNGLELVNAPRERRREGRPEPIIQSGRDTAGCADDAMANSDTQRRPQQEGLLSDVRKRTLNDREDMGNTISSGHDRRSDDAFGRSIGRASAEGPSQHVSVFPPGPSDLSRWRDILETAPELEPAFRRVADGLASRLDTARVDRLRMLGNGVVCLEAAYAFRTLATRLAATGSRGAKRLVLAMDLA